MRGLLGEGGWSGGSPFGMGVSGWMVGQSQGPGAGPGVVSGLEVLWRHQKGQEISQTQWPGLQRGSWASPAHGWVVILDFVFAAARSTPGKRAPLAGHLAGDRAQPWGSWSPAHPWPPRGHPLRTARD